MRARKARQTLAEAADEFLRVRLQRERLPRHRLNDREQIFRAMRQLAHEESYMFLALLLRGDVADDERGTEQIALNAAHWRAANPDVDGAAVAVEPSRLIFDSLAIHQSVHCGLAFGMQFRRDDEQRIFADDILRQIAEQLFGAVIPCPNIVVEIDADDGVDG